MLLTSMFKIQRSYQATLLRKFKKLKEDHAAYVIKE